MIPFSDYNLVWNDEFNGSSVDTNNWILRGSVTNTVSDSILHMKRNGWLISKNRVGPYGTLELKVKYSQAFGVNNQLWTSTANWKNETDYEYVPYAYQINADKQGYGFHAMYCSGTDAQCSNYNAPSGQHWAQAKFINKIVTDWVIIKIVFTSTSVTWYENGIKLHQLISPYVVNLPQAIHINLCAGECTVADEKLIFPGEDVGEMLIDYVRFYDGGGGSGTDVTYWLDETTCLTPTLCIPNKYMVIGAGTVGLFLMMMMVKKRGSQAQSTYIVR